MDYADALNRLLLSDYTYTSYFDPDGKIKKMITLGYISGERVSFIAKDVKGYFRVTELGKQYLEFSEL